LRTQRDPEWESNVNLMMESTLLRTQECKNKVKRFYRVP
jgi:hypothetical protein